MHFHSSLSTVLQIIVKPTSNLAMERTFVCTFGWQSTMAVPIVSTFLLCSIVRVKKWHTSWWFVFLLSSWYMLNRRSYIIILLISSNTTVLMTSNGRPERTSSSVTTLKIIYPKKETFSLIDSEPPWISSNSNLNYRCMELVFRLLWTESSLKNYVY